MSKFLDKIKSIPRIVRNYTPRKLAIVLLGIAAVAVPVAIFAATPLYTWSSPSPSVIFASIVDNPNWPGNDERSFTKIIDQSGNQVTSVDNVTDGQVYTVEMLAHNDAGENLNLYSTNTRAAIGQDLTAGAATSQTLTGGILADNVGTTTLGNAGAFGMFTSTVKFNSNSKFTLQYVSGSAKYQSGFSGDSYTSSPAYTFNLTDSIINTGVPIGNETGNKTFVNSINGQIYGCWPNHGIVTAQFKVVVPPTPTPAYDVAKTVSQNSNTLNYTITATNTGNVDLTNVKLHDNLTSNNVSGTPTNVVLPSGVSGTYPDFTIAKLAAGQKVGITYTINATVTKVTNHCGDTTGTIANTVSSSNDQGTNETNPNNNSTSSTVTTHDDSGCVTPAPSYNLTKTVDKTSAKPGDTLNYTLTFVNSGNTDLTNVVIKDQFPSSQLTLTGKINATVTNGGTVTNLDNLFTSGANVSVVHAGGKVVITFSAKVNDTIIDTTNCKGGTATVLNRSSATSTEDQTETNPNDNDTTTTVTVDSTCSPSFDIAKSVDKTTAQPGDTLTYTLTFKNTGNEPLTNIALTDTLPSGVTLVLNSLAISNNLTYTGDLFANKMVVAGPIAKGASFTITYKVTVNKDIALVCGDNKLTNVVKVSTNEVPTEPDTSNNSATTDMTKTCPTTPTTPSSTTPTTPTTVAATGPTETIAGLLAVGALTFGVVAYLNSRRNLKANIKK